MDAIQIITFYKFVDLPSDKVQKIEKALYDLFAHLDGRGLCILGSEGLNATVSIEKPKADELKTALQNILEVDSLFFKDSFADKHPFHNFSVKIRNEIVTLARTDLVPNTENHNHLSPQEWHRVMTEENPIVIDTRNDYEYEIGRFNGALDPQIKTFAAFPEWLKKSDIPKDKKVLIYCTGGIRCEKAILEMEEQGYNNVYQLDGGIISYLKSFPNAQFDGECFVFDYRVAVDQELRPSTTYRLCPHCGDPAKESIECVQCGVDEIVCTRCLEKGAKETGDTMKSAYRTCSKNCAHHFKLGHKSKRIHSDSFKRRRAQPTAEPQNRG